MAHRRDSYRILDPAPLGEGGYAAPDQIALEEGAAMIFRRRRRLLERLRRWLAGLPILVDLGAML